MLSLSEHRIVKEGLRPTIPYDAHRGFAKLIRACWKDNSSERPSFFKIVSILKNMLEELKDEEITKQRLKIEYEQSMKRTERKKFLTVMQSDADFSANDLVLTVNPLLRAKMRKVSGVVEPK